MFKPRLSGIIEVALGKKEMREFRESLIISTSARAFGVTDHQAAVQAIDGLKRKFFLVDTPEDLETLKEKVLVEKVVLIHKSGLANFLRTCPDCGSRQFDPSPVVTCTDCGTRFKSPGYRT